MGRAVGECCLGVSHSVGWERVNCSILYLLGYKKLGYESVLPYNVVGIQHNGGYRVDSAVLTSDLPSAAFSNSLMLKVLILPFSLNVHFLVV